MKAIQTLLLTKNFGRFPAVQDVNLSVNQGEIFGLLGPNGAGKSTLVKMLVGLVNPSAGSARVFGLSFRELAARRHIGYLPELFRFPPWLTADEVLTYHQRLLKARVDAEERAQLLERVGLRGRETDRVRTFSKGLQQRLGLAVAMVGQPELIFLDEPTSALDPIGRHEVSQILAGLRDSGITIFLNSHLLSDVEKLSDAVALIDRGRILYQGSLDEAIYGSARGYRVHLGKLTRTGADTLLAAFPNTVIQWGKETGQAVLNATLMREVLPQLVSRAVSLGAEVYEVVPDHSSLEDWFLARIGKDGH